MKVSGRRRRRGVSLMEVLISIFVILFGLLSVAALLPVGRFEIAQALRADRAAACGRAGLRDVQVRGLVNPALWRYPDLSPVAPPVGVPPTPAMLPAAAFASFAIDPLYIAANSGAPTLQRFPYDAANGSVWMERVTLREAQWLPPAVAEGFFQRTFTWRDDLTYVLPGDRNARPVVGFNTATGATEVDGNYTWLVTVTPLVDHLPDWPPPPSNPTYYRADGLRKFEVATVVFHKRDFTLPDLSNPKPSERQVGVEFLGAGWGGGDVRLMTPLATVTFINVKRNDWMLLCGLDPAQGGRPVFKWYRIAAVGEPEPNNPGNRMVTLAGPDWRYALDGNGIPGAVMGAIFEGVTGVYTETIEVGGPR